MLIYVCSPYRADTAVELQENIRFARNCCRFVRETGNIPIAPHLYFPQFMDDNDPDERANGLRYAIEALAQCKQLWIFGDRVSDGMRGEIEFANRRGIPFTHFADDEVEDLRQ